jgi:hemoglobin
MRAGCVKIRAFHRDAMNPEPRRTSIPFVPSGGPPAGPGPNPEIYRRMGEAGIFRLCEDFYEAIGRSPIRPMFSEDLPEASKRLAAFLVGACGGPPLYRQRHGEPRMRARHLAFPIDEHARQTWLACFRQVLEDAVARDGFPAEHLPGFLRYLDEFSAWMVNRA